MFFFFLFPSRATLLRCHHFQEYFQCLPSRTRKAFFTGSKAACAVGPPWCACVHVSCIRVGEVRDPRVITGFSRGTYITILALRPRISLCRWRCTGARRIFTRDNAARKCDVRSQLKNSLCPLSVLSFFFYL